MRRDLTRVQQEGAAAAETQKRNGDGHVTGSDERKQSTSSTSLQTYDVVHLAIAVDFASAPSSRGSPWSIDRGE